MKIDLSNQTIEQLKFDLGHEPKEFKQTFKGFRHNRLKQVQQQSSDDFFDQFGIDRVV